MIRFPSIDRDDWPAANELIARLLEDELQDLEPDDFEALVAARCPPWKVLQDQEECALVPRELLLMSQDGYEHRPSVLHQYVLYRCVRAWAEEAAQAIDIDSKSIANRTTHEQLSELLDGAFGEWEFDEAEHYANAVLGADDPNPEKAAAACRLLELMPRDIRIAVSARLKTLGYLPR